MIEAREYPTNEAAKLVGVRPDVLRKWKMRGHLKLAPKGVSGVGRGYQCHWTADAVEEAKAWARLRISGRKRHVPGQSTQTGKTDEP